MNRFGFRFGTFAAAAAAVAAAAAAIAAAKVLKHVKLDQYYC